MQQLDEETQVPSIEVDKILEVDLIVSTRNVIEVPIRNTYGLFIIFRSSALIKK
jgi:hypothetical protein